MCPAAMAGGEGKEHAPAPGARPHTARPVKDRSTYSGAQRPARGVGARLPPRYPLARASTASASTEARLACYAALADVQTAAAVLLVRIARSGLDAGALGHYIAKPCTEEGKPAEGQTQTERPSSPWEADVRVERTLRGRGDDQPSGVGRSGTAAEPARAYAIRRAP